MTRPRHRRRPGARLPRPHQPRRGLRRRRGRRRSAAGRETPHGPVAAVCIWPRLRRRRPRPRSPAPASGSRRWSTSPPATRPARARCAPRRARRSADGADEIDMVVPWRQLAGGPPGGGRRRRCARSSEICGAGDAEGDPRDRRARTTPRLIRRAADEALAGGADFLKTSTGKVPVNATPEAAAILLEAIRASGRDAGLKAAGGVRTTADAGAYLALCDRIMGAGLGDARRISASAPRACSTRSSPRSTARRRRRRDRGATDAAPGDHRPQARRRRPLSAEEIRFMVEGLTARDDHRGPGRRLRHGGAVPRHVDRRAGGADPRHARLRHGARLGPAGAGGRQAFDRRRRRQRQPDARPGARRLRRLRADDLRARPRPHRRHARQVRRDPRLRDPARRRDLPPGGRARSAARSSARPPTSPRPTAGSTPSATSPAPSS